MDNKHMYIRTKNILKTNRLIMFVFLIFVTEYALSQTTKLEAIVAKKAPSWNIAYQKDFGVGRGTIREFLPKGEKIRKWKHLATIQFIEGESLSPKEFMETLKVKMTKRCKETKWNIINETKYTITYEWSIQSCKKNKDQHEIARILQGNDGLHRIAYTEKKNEMDINNKKFWLSVFHDAYVAKGSPDNPVNMESP